MRALVFPGWWRRCWEQSRTARGCKTKGQAGLRRFPLQPLTLRWPQSRLPCRLCPLENLRKRETQWVLVRRWYWLVIQSDGVYRHGSGGFTVWVDKYFPPLKTACHCQTHPFGFINKIGFTQCGNGKSTPVSVCLPAVNQWQSQIVYCCQFPFRKVTHEQVVTFWKQRMQSMRGCGHTHSSDFHSV